MNHPKYELALFIFRRDLRLKDNTALLETLKNSKQVLPCFIIDPRQVKNNPYRSDNSLHFMHESLIDLDDQLKQKDGNLYYFHDQPEKIIEKLFSDHKIDAVYINKDYTPFSVKRDQEISSMCKNLGIDFFEYDDLILNKPSMCLKSDGTPYTVFTPFYKMAKEFPIQKPQQNLYKNYFNKKISYAVSGLEKVVQWKPSAKLSISGGRKACQKVLKSLGNQEHYKATHNILALNTSHLSAYHKFGNYSIREIYWSIVKILGPSHPMIRQLYWRDFFTHIAFNLPHVFGSAFRKSYNSIQWNNDQDSFEKWCKGLTGFPIVDAGMRELNETGFIHNRARLVVGSFLVKDLLIDWQWGERYFATKLIDYDPAVNNGNWQWVASTGCDSQPYFRIFNPWLQQKKFDPDCTYIKKWVPELSHLSPKQIHLLSKQKPIGLENYPDQIVDHSLVSKQVLKVFRSEKEKL